MKSKKTLATAGEVFLLLWALVCLVVFMYFPGAISHIYGVSLYDTPALAEKLSRISIPFFSDTLVSSLGLIFYGIACISFGLVLANIFQLDEKSTDFHHVPGILIPTSFLIGNATFSLLFLLIASLFSITRLYSIIILSLGLLSGLGQFKRLSLPSIRANTGYEKIITGFLIAILAVSLFQSSARISYDSASTYFSYAELSALEHHIGYFLDSTFVVSISQATITYSVMMQLFGDQSARMTSWLFGVMTIWLGMAVAELVGGSRSARRILPILIVTSTAFLDLMGDGKIDLFSSAYSLASIYWFMNAEISYQEKKRSLFIFSGYLTGFACILRPQNVFLFGTFFIVHILQKLLTKQIPFLQLARQLWWLFIGACGFAVYHLMINEIILGSPFAFLSVLTKINPTEGPWDYNPNTVWIYRLLYPLVVTFKNSGASLGNISPLVVAFLPLLIFTTLRKQIKLKNETIRLYITTAIVLFLWILLFFTVVEARYVIFLWIILFIPIAEVISAMLTAQSNTLRRTALVFVVLLMSFILIRSVYISISTYSPIDKQGNPQCYDSALCEQVASINADAEPGDRVLTLSAFRYYLRTDLFACSTDHTEYRTLTNLLPQSTEELWLEVYRQGYKYISYEQGYAMDHVQLKIIPSPENTPRWIKLELIYGKVGDQHIVYRIHVINPPIPVETTCTWNEDSGIWEIQPVIP